PSMSMQIFDLQSSEQTIYQLVALTSSLSSFILSSTFTNKKLWSK
ncbi:36765_t:CDS:1, partial [Gigaspora margarita]